MSDSPKSTTPAQKRATAKYLKERVDTLRIRVPKGQSDVIKDHAAAHGESMNRFVVRAINETMRRDDKGNTADKVQ